MLHCFSYWDAYALCGLGRPLYPEAKLAAVGGHLCGVGLCFDLAGSLTGALTGTFDA